MLKYHDGKASALGLQLIKWANNTMIPKRANHTVLQWFSANIRNEFPELTKPGDKTFARYSADRWLNVVLCHEQYRFCSSITNNCTSFVGLLTPNKSLGQAEYLELFGPSFKFQSGKDSDWALSIVLLETFMQKTPIAWSIAGSSDLALQANRLLNEGHQSKLSDKQWIVEFEFWFTMALARLQLGIFNTIERPLGLDDTKAYNFFAVKGREAIYNICGRIKFNDPYHTSLSTFGLAMILAFSLSLMLASFAGMLLPLIPYVYLLNCSYPTEHSTCPSYSSKFRALITACIPAFISSIILTSPRFVERWKPLVEWERDDALALLVRICRKRFVTLKRLTLFRPPIVSPSKPLMSHLMGRSRHRKIFTMSVAVRGILFRWVIRNSNILQI